MPAAAGERNDKSSKRKRNQEALEFRKTKIRQVRLVPRDQKGVVRKGNVIFEGGVQSGGNNGETRDWTFRPVKAARQRQAFGLAWPAGGGGSKLKWEWP